MKKAMPYIIPVGYGVFGSLALISGGCAAAGMPEDPFARHPIRFHFFYLLLFFVACAALVGLVVCHYKALGYIKDDQFCFIKRHKLVIFIEIVEIAVVGMCAMALWFPLFHVINRTFFFG